MHFAKRAALLLCLVCSSLLTASAATIFEPDSLALEERACKRIKAPVQNGGFETGKLSPWYYDENLGDKGGVNIQPGDNSKHAVQLFIKRFPLGIYLYQNFTVCKGASYAFTYSLFQVPGGTNNAGNPNCVNLYPSVVDPNGQRAGCQTYQAYKTYYSPLLGADNGTHYPAGTWTDWADPCGYTATESGTAQVLLEMLVTSFKCSGTWRIDNVKLQLRS